MATLADLKTAIIADTNRDDLSTDFSAGLLRHIQAACEFYADTKFWFNSIITTATTMPGSNSVTIPATVRIVERVTIPAYNADLSEVILGNFDDYEVSALPGWYAYYNDTLRLYPTPDQAYTLNIYGVAQVAAPSLDADSSIWTNQAKDLIAARTRITLYRDTEMGDSEMVQRAIGAEQDALGRLRRETSRRLQSPLRSNRRVRQYDITVDR